MEFEVAPPIFPCPFSPILSLPSPPSLAFSAEQPHPFASISSHVEGDPTVPTTFPLPPELSFSLQRSCSHSLSVHGCFSTFRWNPSLLVCHVPSSCPCLNSPFLLTHALSHPLFLLGCSPSFCLISEISVWEADCAVSLSCSFSFSHTHPPPPQRCTYKNVAAVIAVQLSHNKQPRSDVQKHIPDRRKACFIRWARDRQRTQTCVCLCI